MSQEQNAGIQINKEVSYVFEISIWLDGYDDIFSSFDSRLLSERTVSDDFLMEVRKVCDEKSGNNIHLKLALPEKQRNISDEKIIVERLHTYFKSSQWIVEKDVIQKNKKGIYFLIAGILLMLVASYISFQKPEKFYIHTLLTLFEPAGWFFLWNGLDHLVYLSKNKKKDLEYYRKMADAVISFENLA